MVVLGRVAPVSPPSSAIMAGYDSEDYSTEARRSCWTPEVGGGHAGPPVSPCRPGMCVSVFGAAAGGGQAPQLAGGCAMAQRKGRALGVAVVPPPPTCRLPVLVEVCPGVLSAPRGREAVVEGHGCGQIPAACVPGSLAPSQPARARTWWANGSVRGVFGCVRHAALPRPPSFARSEPAADQAPRLCGCADFPCFAKAKASPGGVVECGGAHPPPPFVPPFGCVALHTPGVPTFSAPSPFCVNVCRKTSSLCS
jgi:hypothetical protein